jgi:hypothetical protein
MVDTLPELMMIEQKKTHILQFGEYHVYLTWKCDGIFIREDGVPAFVELKTSAHGWQEEDVMGNIQALAYSFLFDISYVERWIFIKDNKPIQRFWQTIDTYHAFDEVRKRIEEILYTRYRYEVTC